MAAPFLLAVAVLAAAAWLLGRAAVALRQPAVMGELAAGLLLSPGLLGPAVGLPDLAAATPEARTLEALALAGALLLLFEVGLGSHWPDLRRAGAPAVRVAALGIAGSIAAGALASLVLAAAFPGWAPLRGQPWLLHLFVGAAFTATSVGLTARVLRDAGRLDSPTGHVILGAAVLDDIGGLAILAAVGALVAGGPDPAALASGLALVAAFGAGLLLSSSPRADGLARCARHPTAALSALFFASVGLHVEAAGLRMHAGAVAVAVLVLTAAAVAGKLASGLGVPRGDRLLVGVGMVPRGEVGFVFAALGLSAGLLAGWPYAAVVLAALATTLLAPPWLAALARRG